MKTTTFIRQLPFNGVAEQRLWKVEPPVKYNSYHEETGGATMKETEYVITSATVAMFTGPETYIFPANKKGEVISWGGLPGSYRGDLNHERAIGNLADETEY